MGWFYGCKLHIVMNQFGKIACSTLSNWHVADIKMVEKLVSDMEAKLYGDRGYISEELKNKLKDQDIDLITYHRKSMQFSMSELWSVVLLIIRSNKQMNIEQGDRFSLF